jgi:hypothetical protein
MDTKSSRTFPTYYVDPASSQPDSDGLTPETAVPAPRKEWLKPGTTLLYRRGRVIRGTFPKFSGAPDAWARIGAYGEGPKPVFMKSRSLADAKMWKNEGENIWRFDEALYRCANLIYNHGGHCGAKRWKKEDLHQPGDWFHEGDDLLVWSKENPGDSYSAIEFAPHEHFMAFENGDCYIDISDVHIQNAGIHGFWVSGGHHLAFRNCDVSFIGGAVFDSTLGVPEGLTVRYGNGFEIWNSGHDVLVEGCRFWEIYDGGAVLQGLNETSIKNVVIRNNIFWDNGFDCFDWSWGVTVENAFFENNTCVDAGGGWARETEGFPRLSAFLPDSVGWHVFCTHARTPSEITIRNNIFFNADRNPLVKLPANREMLSKVVMDYNCYYQVNPNDLMFHLDGQDFRGADFEAYKQVSGFDAHSFIGDPLFVDAKSKNFALAQGSPCLNSGGPSSVDAIDVPYTKNPGSHIGAVPSAS